MTKDVVVILEDEAPVRNGFRQQFEDSELDIELIECSTYDEYKAVISDPLMKQRIKVFIMDLSNNQAETDGKVFKASEYIMDQYANNRVPIFVHSAYLEYYNDLDDKGTVFKVKKDTNSTPPIVESIKLMKDSGFLDIFCFQGSIETKIMTEIHNAFIEQFKSKEIEEIIKSINSVEGIDLRSRTLEVFERIAIRSVYQNLISAKIESTESVKLNVIEHYYRRKGFQFFTGDIFEHRTTQEFVFVATPRCNIANNNFSEILLCQVNNISDEELRGMLKKVDNLRKGITDDVTSSLIGERRRFLPKTPQFGGGFVDFKNTFTIDIDKLNNNYTYKISLVDDLTNDIIRKLSSYLLRGGISDTHYAEAQHYLKEIVNKIDLQDGDERSEVPESK